MPITSVPRPYQRLGHLAIGQTTRIPVPVLAAVSYILHNMKRYSSQVGVVIGCAFYLHTDSLESGTTSRELSERTRNVGWSPHGR